MIYLDNAATSWPKPESVYRELGAFLKVFGANPGRSSHRMAAGTAAAIVHTRELLATLLNAESAERIVFAFNATDALNLAIGGILRPGDRVITSTMEHNSVNRPLRAAQERGVEVIKLESGRNGHLDPDAVAASAREGVQLIAVTHASNVNGTIQPIRALGEIAREFGALLLVDGAQTVGALPVDVQALRIDLLAFPGHKALMGPPGTGGLYIGPRVNLAEFKPIRYGGTGLNSEEDIQPASLPLRYESGTVNTVGVAALAKGIEFIREIGLNTIAAHERALAERLATGLRQIEGVRVYSAVGEMPPAPVVSFTIDGWSPAEAGAVLDQSFDIACRTGLHCAPDACRTIGAFPSGTIRFSPGWFNTDDEIEKAVNAVRELAAAPLG